PAAIGDEIRGAPGAGVADQGGEDGRRRGARDAVHGKSPAPQRDPSFHEIARFALSIDSGEGSSIAGLELTAHQAQHVILDRSTCSRHPVPLFARTSSVTTVKPLSVFGPKSRGENGMSRI